MRDIGGQFRFRLLISDSATGYILILEMQVLRLFDAPLSVVDSIINNCLNMRLLDDDKGALLACHSLFVFSGTLLSY